MGVQIWTNLITENQESLFTNTCGKSQFQFLASKKKNNICWNWQCYANMLFNGNSILLSNRCSYHCILVFGKIFQSPTPPYITTSQKNFMILWLDHRPRQPALLSDVTFLFCSLCVWLCVLFLFFPFSSVPSACIPRAEFIDKLQYIALIYFPPRWSEYLQFTCITGPTIIRQGSWIRRAASVWSRNASIQIGFYNEVLHYKI